MTNDLGAATFETLPTPRQLKAELPISGDAAARIAGHRADIDAIMQEQDDRLLVVVGPCSVHDPAAALDYARRLQPIAEKLSDDVLIVMRVYFEKPRSTGGWKGLINDPHLNGTHDIATGLRVARKLLLDIVELGLPVGTEFLEPVSPSYISDLVSWGAIGARTTESQIHRQMASGLGMPIGFKNATDGDVQVAIDGVTVAAQQHTTFGIDDDGRAAIVTTRGNNAGHIILRGGRFGPNYGTHNVIYSARLLARAGLSPRIIVDASHANSGKSHIRQLEVARELAAQIADGEPIAGVMIESFIEPGAQKLTDAGLDGLVYGQSITDACIGWDDTAALLEDLAAAARRAARLEPVDV